MNYIAKNRVFLKTSFILFIFYCTVAYVNIIAVFANSKRTNHSVPKIGIVKSRLTASFMPNSAYYLQEIDFAQNILKNIIKSNGIVVTTVTDKDLEKGGLTKKDFSLLVLPNVKNMSEVSIRNIKEYVLKGNGKILAFHMTSYRSSQDEMAQNQNNFQLADIFGADFLRWSNDPPFSQFLLLKPILKHSLVNKHSLINSASPPNALAYKTEHILEKIELGRNTSMLVKPRDGSKVLATWGNGPDGKIQTLPGNLGSAIVENKDGNCIYAGENLLAQENLASPLVRILLTVLMKRLLPAVAVILPDPGKPTERLTNPSIYHATYSPTYFPNIFFPLHLARIQPFGRKIRIGIRIPLNEVTVTASTKFQLWSKGRLLQTLPSQTFANIKMQNNQLVVKLPKNSIANNVNYISSNAPYHVPFNVSHLRIVPLYSNALVSYMDFRKNGTYQIKRFRGELEIFPKPQILKHQIAETQISKPQMQIVNILDLNYYLAGVVPHEVPFHFPKEALSAMAVVARTFALKSLDRHSQEGFDLCNTVHCQAYEGVIYEAPSSTFAVSNTHKAVVFYQGELADITYHSTCGGTTEDIKSVWNLPQKPYLNSIRDWENPQLPKLKTSEDVALFLEDKKSSFCSLSSRFRWEETYTKEELEALFNESLPVTLNRHIVNFKLKDLEVLERTESGRVKSLLVTGSYMVNNIKEVNEKFIIPQEKIRWLFSAGKLGLTGLQSTLFVIKKENMAIKEKENMAIKEKEKHNNNSFTIRITGGGWGHGVGMCQFGARGMAYKGKSYSEILTHYFPQTSVLIP